uniref:Uncharacterized protein n=1 Tax=Setaria viridis TaxID=4556 RepID=A0A4U6T1D8_SETVI|nr:hypothetical protein SEVIR_9G238900v2 [Setaria viridis]TKV93633.1 hypothetical protein SEVIR_9G238900v2 [Setaria viridis]
MEEPEPELAVPWSPADPSELSRAQTMEMGLGDLSAQQQFGLSSTIAPQPPLQMKVYLAHDDAMMDRQFGDTDLAKWIAKLLKSGASNPSPSPETNIHHQMEDEDVEVKLLLRGPQDESHLPAVFGVPLDHAYDIHQWDDKFYSVAWDDAREAEPIHLNHDIKDYIVMPSLLDLVPTQGSLGVKGQTKCRTRSTYWKGTPRMESLSYTETLGILHNPFGSVPSYCTTCKCPCQPLLHVLISDGDHLVEPFHVP